MDLGLRDKHAVITGGGGAILGETARVLAAEGAAVAVWDLSLEAAQSVAAEITDSGGRAVAVACNATDRDSVRSAVKTTYEAFGSIEILINGAGGSRPQTTTAPDRLFFDIDPTDMRAVMDLNYLSTVICCQEVGRLIAASGAGAIVNVTSIAGVIPLTAAIAYSNAKAAANSLTQWLAVHMAQNYSPKIRVNAIAPGFVLTEQNRFLLIDAKTGQPTPRGKRVTDVVPMARYGTPREIADVIAFLVSEQARFMSGSVVVVDGGLTAFAGV